METKLLVLAEEKLQALKDRCPSDVERIPEKSYPENESKPGCNPMPNPKIGSTPSLQIFPKPQNVELEQDQPQKRESTSSMPLITETVAKDSTGSDLIKAKYSAGKNVEPLDFQQLGTDLTKPFDWIMILDSFIQKNLPYVRDLSLTLLGAQKYCGSFNGLNIEKALQDQQNNDKDAAIEEKAEKLFEINSKIDLETIKAIINGKAHLALSKEAEEKIAQARKYLDKKMADSKEPIYGINTGFGSLCNVKIAPKDYSLLQTNLLRSHACGSGTEVPGEIVKIMLLLKVQSLSYGHSGVEVSTVERLIRFYNNDILPVVYEQGSLGASGDLAPLAHLCLPLIGEGEVYHNGKKKAAAELHKELKWVPLKLQPKEGLALLNGTQFMSAYGVWLILKAQGLTVLGDKIAAMSLDGFDCRLEPFNKLIHQVRPHKGQKACAAFILETLKGSKIAARTKTDVQDPYSFRCIPQVHGAIRDVVEHVKSVFLQEINSVTDNPLIFPDEDEIISGGNFHGHPLAMALDYLTIALADLGNISERRTYKLISGQRGLPAFLVKSPGLNSGLMILQYSAASVVSQNKQYATPASVDSSVSSNGQEDYVSMGANAATKCYKVIQNLKTILAAELITAAQALTFRKPEKTSPVLETMLAKFQKQVPFIDKDRIIHDAIKQSVAFIEENL